MNLPRDSREFAHWPITGAPVGATFEGRFSNRTSTSEWLTLERVSDTEARLLIAGPNASPTGAAIVLPVGRTTVDIRVPDVTEIVVRGGGYIDVI